MMPHDTPTNPVSARHAVIAASCRSIRWPRRSDTARAVETSSAADELSPAPAGTSLATARSIDSDRPDAASSGAATPTR